MDIENPVIQYNMVASYEELKDIQASILIANENESTSCEQRNRLNVIFYKIQIGLDQNIALRH